MRCREVPAWLLDRELGSLPAQARAALASHLARCPACAIVAREEQRLSRDLELLRRSLVQAPDVTARILRELPSAHTHRTVEAPSVRQLGWATAIAVAASAMLVAAIASVIGGLPARLDAWARAADPVQAVLRPLVRALSWIVTFTWDVLGPVLAGLAADHAALLGSWAAGSLLVGAALMATTIALVVGHDLRGRRLAAGGRS